LCIYLSTPALRSGIDIDILIPYRHRPRAHHLQVTRLTYSFASNFHSLYYTPFSFFNVAFLEPNGPNERRGGALDQSHYYDSVTHQVADLSAASTETFSPVNHPMAAAVQRLIQPCHATISIVLDASKSTNSNRLICLPRSPILSIFLLICNNTFSSNPNSQPHVSKSRFHDPIALSIDFFYPLDCLVHS
jgi:hypothetical protein